MTVAGLGFAFGMVVRDVTVLTVVLSLGSVVLVGAVAAARSRNLIAAEVIDARTRWLTSPRSPGHPWPFAVVVLVCGAWTIHFLHQAYV